MASSLRTLRHFCSAVRDFQKVQLTTSRNVHLSAVSAANKKPGSASNTSSTSQTRKSSPEKDDLLGAAAEVAASMKGLEEEAFSDLFTQLAKLDEMVDERAASQSILTPKGKMAKIFSDKKTDKPALDPQAQKRISVIKKIYNPKAASETAANVEKLVAKISLSASASNKAADRASSKPTDKPIRSEASPVTQAGTTPPSPQSSNTESVGEGVKAYDEKLKQERASRYDAARQQRSAWFSERLDQSLEQEQQELMSSSERRRPRRVQQDGRRPREDHREWSDERMGNRRRPRIADGTIRGAGLLQNVKPFNIFNPSKWTADSEAETVPMVQSWVDEGEASLRHAQLLPFNGFEEMIRLTEEGKIWKYPIDNEQGLEEEKNTPFYEHVFLDKHLTAFPETGPVRRFMQLVATGLSNNPHLSVKEKVAHIQWFEEYFQQKQSLVTAEQLLADKSKVSGTVQS